MHTATGSTRHGTALARGLACCAMVTLAACASTERRANDAHQEFKREVRPAAEWVDEKTNTAVGEGKKAVRKTADAIAGEDSGSKSQPRQQPSQPDAESSKRSEPEPK